MTDTLIPENDAAAPADAKGKKGKKDKKNKKPKGLAEAVVSDGIVYLAGRYGMIELRPGESGYVNASGVPWKN